MARMPTLAPQPGRRQGRQMARSLGESGWGRGNCMILPAAGLSLEGIVPDTGCAGAVPSGKKR
jgi:hypothetical protein